MNQRQNKKLNHFRDIKGVFKLFAAVILKYSRLKLYVDDFDAAVKRIEVTVKVTSGTGPEVVTADLQSVEESLSEFAAILAGAASTYARDQEDVRLKEVFKVTKSALKSMSNERMLVRVQNLCDELDNLGEALDQYEVSAEDRQQLRDQVELFAELAVEQGGSQAGRKKANKVQESLFTDVSKQLQKIDLFMRNLGRKEPDMTETYFACREKNRRYKTTGSPLPDSSSDPDPDPVPDTEQ